jgi:hypothetical protein
MFNVYISTINPEDEDSRNKFLSFFRLNSDQAAKKVAEYNSEYHVDVEMEEEAKLRLSLHPGIELY